MPLLSFSGTTSQGPFWRQIEEGRKTQTCRLPRKNPIKEGDLLRLYWRVRVPIALKPVHFIGVAECLKVERKRFGEFKDDDEFAMRDGFEDSAELRVWFGAVEDDEEYDVIHFKVVQKARHIML